jgi:hypothetical protein
MFIFSMAARVMNFISAVSSLHIYFFNVHISQPYKTDGMAKILQTFTQDSRWTKYGFKTSPRIIKNFKNLLNFVVMPFSSSRKILHPKYVNILGPF